MNEVLAVVGSPGDGVARLAAEVGRLLSARVVELDLADLDLAGRADVSAAVAERTARPAVQALVMRGDTDLEADFWKIAAVVTKPVVALPAGLTGHRRPLDVVLLPLDGTVASAELVSPAVDRLLHVGARVLATHVFDAATVPAFWDQAAHSHDSWSEEFLRRHLPLGVSLDLRRGRPAEEVLAAAEAAGAGLVVLGWSRRTEGGSARTVRLLVGSQVPVMLVGTPLAPAEEEAPGPSALNAVRDRGEHGGVTPSVRLDLATALEGPVTCPACGAVGLEDVASGDQTVFGCRGCGSRWIVDQGVLVLLDPPSSGSEPTSEERR